MPTTRFSSLLRRALAGLALACAALGAHAQQPQAAPTAPAGLEDLSALSQRITALTGRTLPRDELVIVAGRAFEHQIDLDDEKAVAQ